MNGFNGTALAPDLLAVERTNRYYLSQERTQVATNQSTQCSVKEGRHLLLEEKQTIAQCDDLESETERRAIALAPMIGLSDDILRHIFELLCKDWMPVVLPLYHPVRGIIPPQIQLSHVCSAWREIMLDLPTLWSTLEIIPRTSRTFDFLVEVANLWLSRAKGLPCSIKVDFHNADACYESLSEKNSNIIRNLILLHNIKNLDVTFADHQLQDFLQLPDDTLSCVKHLSLRYISSNVTSAALFDLHKLSNLSSFSLLPNPFDSLDSRPVDKAFEGYHRFSDISWHNLLHIQFGVPMPALFCVEVLEYSSAVLETCSLVIVGVHSLKPLPREPIYFPRLRDFKLNMNTYFPYTDQKFLESFLLSLRFPKLKSLTLGDPLYSVVPIDVPMLLSIQNASRMHLEELIIQKSASIIHVHALLIGFPSLRRLELPETVIFTSDAMLDVGAGTIGAFLEDLKLNDPNLDFENLLQMVKARSHSSDQDSKHQVEVTKFKTVTLYCDDSEDQVEDKIWEIIEEINLSGVSLEVVFADPYSDYW